MSKIIRIKDKDGNKLYPITVPPTIKIEPMSQSEYDALTTKDDGTLYFVYEDEG